MQKTIDTQLKSCLYANLNNFDTATNTYHIPKYTKPNYQIGKCYLIKLSANIVKNPNSVLAVNWNNGRAPQVEILKIYISKALGKNIYVDSLGYDLETQSDTNYMWAGWLNIDDLTLIKEL